uniref:Uncharacterized protein n=1 Tax=Romanomermis culicivorax TaxID=13658 RepID=A0A915IBF5_ROMCU
MVEESTEDYSTSVKKTANYGVVKDHLRPHYTRHFMLRTIFSISFSLFLLSWPSSQAISWLLCLSLKRVFLEVSSWN